ncbi:hypothetical protein [Uliginosibacterium gangwonense]|uniref:hypothetical protein n=1 Tax=Uliginosibacterium gangwonense TaxID=392736 RepID=UPI0003775BC9|nr:hypothetical protein [Uliginosibacterium gangwonense]
MSATLRRYRNLAKFKNAPKRDAIGFHAQFQSMLFYPPANATASASPLLDHALQTHADVLSIRLTTQDGAQPKKRRDREATPRGRTPSENKARPFGYAAYFFVLMHCFGGPEQVC